MKGYNKVFDQQPLELPLVIKKWFPTSELMQLQAKVTITSSHLFSLSLSSSLHYACCYDEIKGNQDLKTCSDADSLILSLLLWNFSASGRTGCNREVTGTGTDIDTVADTHLVYTSIVCMSGIRV